MQSIDTLKQQIIHLVQAEKDYDLLDFLLKLLFSEGGH